MRKTLKVVAFGGGPADAFIKAAGITDSTQQTAIKTLVNDLNGYGLWSKMKAIYPMVGGTATAHSYNLKDITKFQITWNGGITHSSTGVLFNGTTGYGNTNFNPTSELNISSNFMSQYIRTNNSDTASSMGCFTGVGQSYVLTIDGTNVTSRNTSAVISGSTTTRLGLSATVRTSPSINGLFKNSTKIFTGNTESGPSYPSYNIFIGQFNFLGSPYAGYYSANQYAFATIGEGLSDTEAANLYTSIQKFQTTLNRFVGTPIYPSFDSDAQSFMTSASITDSTQQSAVNYLVTDLKSANLWSKMKAIYPMVGGTASSHSYNLKNPAQFQITWSGGLTHSSTGVLPNGTNGYGNTNLNESINCDANSGSISYYSRTNTSLADVGIGIASASSFSIIYFNGLNNSFAINNSSFPGAVVSSNNAFLMANRIGTNTKGYRNGTPIISSTLSVNALLNGNIFIGAMSQFGSGQLYTNKECAFATIGDGLTDTEASNLYTIIQNYQTILSRQV